MEFFISWGYHHVINYSPSFWLGSSSYLLKKIRQGTKVLLRSKVLIAQKKFFAKK
jgi:hypothetical protein